VSSQIEAALIAAVVSLISLSGTILVAIIGFRTTRSVTGSTLAEQRARTLNERFATAADKLGSDKPPAVRLAGVYAMAGLADDWPENRQICVEVLCAYLRLPHESDPGEDAPAEKRLQFGASREVRHTVIRVIAAHLKDDAAVSWQGLNFDFTGVVFDGGSFTRARFSGGEVSFVGAEFSGGKVDFQYAEFSGGVVDFSDAKFSGGEVSFRSIRCSGGVVGFVQAEFSGATVTFWGAQFSSSWVPFSSAEFSGGEVSFSDTEFSGRHVEFTGAKFSGGEVSFNGAKFSGGEVSFGIAEFSGGEVSFNGAKFSGGEVSFDAAEFSGATVSFREGKFSGGKVSFLAAKFPGGEVDFSDPGDWSSPPKFAWIDIPPQGVKLPHKEDQSPV
jgi:uncharacterized protein YjbI with pentapeptide repeats